jgi:hypothetical protein
LLRDTNKINYDVAKYFLNELKEISNIFGASLVTMRNKKV